MEDSVQGMSAVIDFELDKILNGLTQRQKDQVYQWIDEFRLTALEIATWRANRDKFIKSANYKMPIETPVDKICRDIYELKLFGVRVADFFQRNGHPQMLRTCGRVFTSDEAMRWLLVKSHIEKPFKFSKGIPQKILNDLVEENPVIRKRTNESKSLESSPSDKRYKPTPTSPDKVCVKIEPPGEDETSSGAEDQKPSQETLQAFAETVRTAYAAQPSDQEFVFDTFQPQAAAPEQAQAATTCRLEPNQPETISVAAGASVLPTHSVSPLRSSPEFITTAQAKTSPTCRAFRPKDPRHVAPDAPQNLRSVPNNPPSAQSAPKVSAPVRAIVTKPSIFLVAPSAVATPQLPQHSRPLVSHSHKSPIATAVRSKSSAVSAAPRLQTPTFPATILLENEAATIDTFGGSETLTSPAQRVFTYVVASANSVLQEQSASPVALESQNLQSSPAVVVRPTQESSDIAHATMIKIYLSQFQVTDEDFSMWLSYRTAAEPQGEPWSQVDAFLTLIADMLYRIKQEKTVRDRRKLISSLANRHSVSEASLEKWMHSDCAKLFRKDKTYLKYELFGKIPSVSEHCEQRYFSKFEEVLRYRLPSEPDITALSINTPDPTARVDLIQALMGFYSLRRDDLDNLPTVHNRGFRTSVRGKIDPLQLVLYELAVIVSQRHEIAKFVSLFSSQEASFCFETGVIECSTISDMCRLPMAYALKVVTPKRQLKTKFVNLSGLGAGSRNVLSEMEYDEKTGRFTQLKEMTPGTRELRERIREVMDEC